MPSKKIVSLSANPEGFGRVPDPLGQDMFVSEIPVQHTHMYYEDEESGVSELRSLCNNI
ncbi:MAG: hypothetical protein IMF06_00985 [Proteobacteria bacterium]|nr:hypothetical protein [Pseudomonadota bacterium]